MATRKKLAEDPDLRRIAGDLFRGWGTNWTDLEGACSWAIGVRRETPIINPHSIPLRKAVFTLGQDQAELARHLACVIPTMRDAFLELATLSPEELKKTQAREKTMQAKVDAAYEGAKTDPSKLPEFNATIAAAFETEPVTKQAYVSGTIGGLLGLCSVVLVVAACVIVFVGAIGALLNYLGTPEFILSATTAILLGASLFIFSARYIGDVRLTLKDSLWTSAIAHVFSIIVSGILGFMLSSHLGIGLVLATVISLIFEAALFKIQARARKQTLKTGRAYSIAIMMLLSDIFISSPIVAFIIARKI
jgi:hypothetical protein